MQEEVEIWKPFPMCENYLVSSFGRVKSIERTATHSRYKCGTKAVVEKLLSLKENGYGYPVVHLSINKEKKRYLAHRVVGLTFIPNPDNKPQINHKNGIRNDNRVSNLEWVTNSENGLHSFRVLGRKPVRNSLGKFGSKHHRAKRVYCPNFELYFGSAREAARELGISQGSISHVCNNDRSHAEGLTFEYR